MKRLSIVMLLCFALLVSVAASVMGVGIDVVQYTGGVWTTTHVNDNDYIAVSGDATAGNIFYGVRKDGAGLDYIYKTGGTWYTTQINNVAYRCVCHDPVYTKYLYAGRRDGGCDVIIWNGTSWVTYSSVVPGWFTSLTPDRATAYCVYGTASEGGVWKIYWNGSAWALAQLSGSGNISFNAVSGDGGVNGRAYGAVGCYGGLYAFAGGASSFLSSSCYAGICPDRVTSSEVYGVRCDGWIDGIVGTTIFNLLSGIYSTACTTDRTTTNTFYDAASTGPDSVWYAPGWTHANLGTSTQYTAMDHDGASTKQFVAAQLPSFKTSTLNFSNLSGVSSITIKSRWYGFQSAINRDFTPAGSANRAYDYTVSCIKDTSVSEPYRLYWGARWSSSYGDGDHVAQVRSKNGLGNTWYMPHPSRPEKYNGAEEGYPNSWYYSNYLSPQVLKVGNTYYMYTNCQIFPGKPIDYPAGATAAVMQGRIQLFTSTDGDNWTRKSDRGVITNIANPTYIGQCYNETVYESSDSSGKPWWLYCWETYSSSTGQMYRIKSNDPTTFDYNNRELMGTALTQYGNVIGIANESPGGHLYARISFVVIGTSPNDQWIPSMEFSRDGINWTYGSNGPVQMDGGTDDNLNNKRCFNLGMSLIDGIRFEYLGNNTFRAIYLASTGSSPDPNGDTGIVRSEIGCGEMQFTVNP